MPRPVRRLFELAADGVKLTPGGRLPRAFVRQVQEHYPSWSVSERPASVEEDLPPLAALHDLLRHVGLLRLHRGILGPTRAAADELDVVRRLRSWFRPDDGFVSILVSDAVANLVVDGPCRPDGLAARLLPVLGDRWVTSQGERLDVIRVRQELYGLQSILVALDLIQSDDEGWLPGPSALWLLPRATALADIWSKWQAFS